MTVKVIGTDPKFIKNVNCSKCGSILEYVQNDETPENFRDYTGSDWGKAITCPTCKNRIRVG